MLMRLMEFLFAGAMGTLGGAAIHATWGVAERRLAKRRTVQRAEFTSRQRARDPRRARTAPASTTQPTGDRKPARVTQAYVQE